MAGKGYVEIDGAVKVIGKYYVEVDGLSKKVEKIYVKDAQGKSKLAYVAHVHSWTVTRTYLNDNYHTKTNTCACGAQEAIAEGHYQTGNRESGWHKNSTHHWDHYICACGKCMGQATKYEHSSTKNWTNITYATCTSSGSRYRNCDACGQAIYDYPAALGHDYKVKSKVPSTCTVRGSATYVCSRCGDSYTETLAYAAHKKGPDGKCLYCGLGFEIMQ